MSKTEIFAELVNAVVETTEISKEVLMSNCKQEEVVDARYILVHLLSERGFYPTCIASRMGKSSRNINHFIAHFESRLETRKNLRIMFEHTKRKLGQRQEE